eukprot:gene12434-biopygen4773
MSVEDPGNPRERFPLREDFTRHTDLACRRIFCVSGRLCCVAGRLLCCVAHRLCCAAGRFCCEAGRNRCVAGRRCCVAGRGLSQDPVKALVQWSWNGGRIVLRMLGNACEWLIVVEVRSRDSERPAQVLRPRRVPGAEAQDARGQ